MTLFRNYSLFPVRLHLVVCGLMLLLGAEPARAQIRTVLVSPVPGDPVASGTALRNALAGIPSSSSTDRWLLKIEPGIYDVGTTSIRMRSWVDIEGSGIGVTTIRGSAPAYDATIRGANNAELRLLTVEALGNTATPFPVIAMANSDASPRLYRVKLFAIGDGAWGVRNINAAPVIEECEITVSSTSTANMDSVGIAFRGTPPPAGRSSIFRSKIYVSGAKNNYGVFMGEAQFVTEIRDSRVDAVGGTTAHGVYAVSSSWTGQETLRIRDTEIYSSGGSSASYGINFEPGTSIVLNVNESRVWGSTYGIRQGGAVPMGVQGSFVLGATQAIRAEGNLSVASTHLEGGPVNAQGWYGCMGVWDENGVFFTNSCP
ncbi:MAG TPA: hypothetical protein VF756_21005 [Thermoanaerobaculia bacterium]